MRILNVGIREVILLLVIMLILFGPRQMRENARNLARAIRKFIRSDTWRAFIGVVDDVNTIKDQVVRESGLQEIQDSLRGVTRSLDEIDTDLHRENLAEPRPNGPVTTEQPKQDTDESANE